uniref:Endonuclease/exonuclease/phosphatase domain-containing protein n=1 Tax=Setaria viridis TaxID=4556 RepID=A0A4U6TMK4_SETVI|nr:hypothetical protein SEVIR_8G201200v2 [Setaria viridis]
MEPELVSGEASRRPDHVSVYVQRTVAAREEERQLSLTALISIQMNGRAKLSAQVVHRDVLQQLGGSGTREQDLGVKHLTVSTFLLHFSMPEQHTTTLWLGGLCAGQTTLWLLPWTRQVRASASKLHYRAKVCIEGIPEHAQQVDTVARLFNSTMFIEDFDTDADTEQERDCLCVWVWTFNPDGLAKTVTLKIDEPLTYPEEYYWQMGEFELPTIRTGPAEMLNYEVIIHLDRVFDYSPLPSSPLERSYHSGVSGLPEDLYEDEWPIKHHFVWYYGFLDDQRGFIGGSSSQGGRRGGYGRHFHGRDGEVPVTVNSAHTGAEVQDTTNPTRKVKQAPAKSSCFCSIPMKGAATTIKLTQWQTRRSNKIADKPKTTLVIEEQAMALLMKNIQETKMEEFSDILVSECLGKKFSRIYAYLPTQGTRGGILLAVNEDYYNIKEYFIKNNSITALVYGPQGDSGKLQFLEEIKQIAGMISDKWLFLGDFNMILQEEDKNCWRVYTFLAKTHLPRLPRPRLLQLADLAVRLATLPPCTCGYLGGVAPAALGRAADELPTSHDEPTTSRGIGGDLAARGRAAEELLDVIDYPTSYPYKNNININKRIMGAFRAVVHALELRELNLRGRRYTWTNNVTHIRIDRVFCNLVMPLPSSST